MSRAGAGTGSRDGADPAAGRAGAGPAGEPRSRPRPPVPDLPAELFPAPVRPAVFRVLWLLTALLIAGLGAVAWHYHAAAGL